MQKVAKLAYAVWKPMFPLPPEKRKMAERGMCEEESRKKKRKENYIRGLSSGARC